MTQVGVTVQDQAAKSPAIEFVHKLGCTNISTYITSFKSKKIIIFLGIFKMLPILDDFFQWLGHKVAGAKSGGNESGGTKSVESKSRGRPHSGKFQLDLKNYSHVTYTTIFHYRSYLGIYIWWSKSLSLQITSFQKSWCRHFMILLEFLLKL